VTVDNPDSIAERVRRSEARLETTLDILVWGPGKTALDHWYQKRLTVVDFLKNADQRFKSTTSEEIFESLGPRGDIEWGPRELLHVQEADLIFVLILGPPEKQGGVYRELDLISRYRKFRDKTWIFLPDQSSYRKKFTAGSLSAFRESHLIPYPWEVLKECNEVRRVCREKAEEEIRQKAFDKLYTILG